MSRGKGGWLVGFGGLFSELLMAGILGALAAIAYAIPNAISGFMKRLR